MKKKLGLKKLEPAGRRVLMRVDFNVPLDGERRITDDLRIRAALPSIEYVLENGGSTVLMSHLGRPKGKAVPEMSLRPVADRLGELLDAPVKFAHDTIGSDARGKAEGLQPGEVLLVENLRFQAGETANESDFAHKLADLGDVYANDAFGTAHRAHASTVGVTEHFSERYAGFLMERELENLGALLDQPRAPFVAVLGGAKVKGKVDVILNLLDRVDTLLLGGGMIYTFFKVHGLGIGDSLLDDESLDTVREVTERAKKSRTQLVLPSDCTIAPDFSDKGEVRRVLATDIPDGWQGLDIGPETAKKYGEVLRAAKTIFWNGPLGVFEIPTFAAGTRATAEAVVDATRRGARSVVGGGDSLAALSQLGFVDEVTHASTGGGASLEFMAGKELPGVAALSDA
jgi:phosphoglycerate kinase